MTSSGRPQTAADCLRAVVKFLDLGDQAIRYLAQVTDMPEPRSKNFTTARRQVQHDLEAMAAWLDVHPDVDTALHSACEVFDG